MIADTVRMDPYRLHSSNIFREKTRTQKESDGERNFRLNFRTRSLLNSLLLLRPSPLVSLNEEIESKIVEQSIYRNYFGSQHQNLEVGVCGKEGGDFCRRKVDIN